jgi:hypothetical protein
LFPAVLSGCDGGDHNSKATTKSTAEDTTRTVSAKDSNETPAGVVLRNYLVVKNALANDDSEEAAKAGDLVAESIGKVDGSSLAPEQQKLLGDVKEDIKEHGEHIGSNAGKIEHQRGHFESMSQDVYDLVKIFKTQQELYWTHCPMYDNGKGADWLSEVKEIKNPYLGKKMPTCGTIKEEIKQ